MYLSEEGQEDQFQAQVRDKLELAFPSVFILGSLYFQDWLCNLWGLEQSELIKNFKGDGEKKEFQNGDSRALNQA